MISISTRRKAYPSDVTDAQWELLAPFIPEISPLATVRTVERHEIINGILYVLRTGCSCIGKPRGEKMEGLGLPHDSKVNNRVIGHCLVQGLYVLLGQHFPLQPQLYRQQCTCEKEGVDFESKVDQMIGIITDFQPPEHTLTHVLLDSWYRAGKMALRHLPCREMWYNKRKSPLPTFSASQEKSLCPLSRYYLTFLVALWNR